MRLTVKIKLNLKILFFSRFKKSNFRFLAQKLKFTAQNRQFLTFWFEHGKFLTFASKMVNFLLLAQNW